MNFHPHHSIHTTLRQGRHGPSAQGGAAFAAHRGGGAAAQAAAGARGGRGDRGDRGRIHAEGGRFLGAKGRGKRWKLMKILVNSNAIP